MRRSNTILILYALMILAAILLVVQIQVINADESRGNPNRGGRDPLEAPTDITIDPETYLDQFDELYIRAGGEYNLSATAQSSGDNPDMDRVVFQQSDADYGGATWVDIGTDDDTSDNTYTVTWYPDTQYYYLRAIAYDIHGGEEISESFSAFHVDGEGPVAPLYIEATVDLDPYPAQAEINGYVYDTIVEGQTSGADFAVLWHLNNASGTLEIWEEDGEPLITQVINYQFFFEVDLKNVDNTNLDISYSFIVQAYDHVGNAGNLSGQCVWTDTGHQDSVRIISPASVQDVYMEDRIPHPDDARDEVRLYSVTFLETEQDFMNYPFIIRHQQLESEQDAADLGLPENTTFLEGYYHVELSPYVQNYNAQVTMEFHISPDSPLGGSTSEILDDIRFCARHSGETEFQVLDLISGGPQEVDAENGLYRVTARVDEFSDFIIVLGQPDLTVKEIIPGANPAISGQNVKITVTVNNGGDFPKDAGTETDPVEVYLVAIYEDLTQETIGMLDFGIIESDTDYFPEDPTLVEGDKQVSIYWQTSTLIEMYTVEEITLRAIVDPGLYIEERDETNNEGTQQLEIIGASGTPPTLNVTEPEDGITINGTITCSGTSSVENDEYTIDTTEAPFGDGDRAFHVQTVYPASPSVHTLEYILLNDQQVGIPGAQGIVADIYGLNLDDQDHPISFQDNDRDGKASPGDVFLFKSQENGGYWSDGYSLLLRTDSIQEVESIQLSVNNGTWGVISYDNNWTYQWNSTNVVNGNTSLRFRAFGGGAYSVVIERFIDVLNPVENVIPVVTITEPSDGGKVSGNVTIKGTASDENGIETIETVEISIDGGSWIEVTGTGSWSYQWPSMVVTDGNHTIKVRCFDGTNYSEVKTITVMVENIDDKEEDEGDGDSFLFEKIGPIPTIGYLGILIVMVVVGVFVMRKKTGEKKTGNISDKGAASTQGTQSETQQTNIPAPVQSSFAAPSSQTPSSPQITFHADGSWTCPKCGNQLKGQFTFCMNCGFKRDN